MIMFVSDINFYHQGDLYSLRGLSLEDKRLGIELLFYSKRITLGILHQLLLDADKENQMAALIFSIL